MKIKFLLSLFFTFLWTTLLQAQTQGYRYEITIKGMEDTVVYLGHHYGNKQFVIDTVPTDHKGTAIFTGSDTLKGGLYLLVMPALGNKYFEFIGGEPSFSLSTSVDDFTGKMTVKGSVENKLMYDDLNFINPRREKINKLRTEYADSGKTEAQKTDIETKINQINDEVANWRAQIQRDYGNTLYAKILRASQDITLPEAPKLEDGSPDKAYLLRFVRQHYFDDVDFSDPRMLRTNILWRKTEQYMQNYVPKVPDSIIIALDFILEKAAGNNEVFQFFTVTFLNQYATSDIMGMDAVFVHLADKYYKTGKAFWLDDAGLFRITQKADLMKPTLIGKQAPQVMLQDTSNMDIPLYAVNSKYTIVLIWDVDCGHCKKEMPKIEAAYPELKQLGVEIYSIYAEEEWDKWKDWLKEHQYPWINVGNMKRKSNFQVQYNVDQTPMIFILDKNKKIIAKKIGAEQLVDFLKKYEEINAQ